MKRTLCARELLAQSALGLVERCECGALHLTLGALSLRLDATGLRALQGLLARALDALDTREGLSLVRPRGEA